MKGKEWQACAVLKGTSNDNGICAKRRPPVVRSDSTENTGNRMQRRSVNRYLFDETDPAQRLIAVDWLNFDCKVLTWFHNVDCVAQPFTRGSPSDNDVFYFLVCRQAHVHVRVRTVILPCKGYGEVEGVARIPIKQIRKPLSMV